MQTPANAVMRACEEQKTSSSLRSHSKREHLSSNPVPYGDRAAFPNCLHVRKVIRGACSGLFTPTPKMYFSIHLPRCKLVVNPSRVSITYICGHKPARWFTNTGIPVWRHLLFGSWKWLARCFQLSKCFLHIGTCAFESTVCALVSIKDFAITQAICTSGLYIKS